MKKLIIALFVSILVLTGCKDMGYPSFNDVTIKEKEKIEGTAFVSAKYVITLEKNGQEIDLKALYLTDYNVLKVGQIVNVKYDSDYYIRDIEFPILEGDE